MQQVVWFPESLIPQRDMSNRLYGQFLPWTWY